MAKALLVNVRLGADPEVKGERAWFRVAETITKKGQKETVWYSVSYYKKDIGKLIGKGCRVTIEGNIEASLYKDKINLTVWADQVHIHDFKDSKAEGDKPEAAAETPPPDSTPF